MECYVLYYTYNPKCPIYFGGGKSEDADNNENRDMAEKPVLSIDNYENFPEEYEKYYNDNLPYRSQMIQFHNSIDYFVFGQPSNKNVAIGSDGWLFYCEDSQENPIEQSLGYWLFTEAQLEQIADNLVATQKVLESRGIEFVLFIAPNKATIYNEYLPKYYSVQDEVTSVGQLVSFLREKTSIRVVYPREALLASKSEFPDIILYQKLDTHWNNAGAYIGAVSLANELGIEIPLLNEVKLERVNGSSGDLTDMLNITIENGNIDYDISEINGLNTECEKFDFSTEFLYHTARADKRRLFVRMDSFSIALAPSLATQFENSRFVHKNYFNQDQIFDYGTDVFVLEVVERKIAELGRFMITQ